MSTRIDTNDRVTQRKEAAAEDHLDEISLNDNPYEEMVDDCTKRQSHQSVKPSPKKPWIQLMTPDQFLAGDFQMPTPNTTVAPDTNRNHPNDSGIKIIFNDEEDDVPEMEARHNTYWVSRQMHCCKLC